MDRVFVSGGTGYLGRPLIQQLRQTGAEVHALARVQSLQKLPPGCIAVAGDALRAESFQSAVPPGATFVHLTGVAKPSPAKARAFRAIDLVAFEASLQAAIESAVAHFIYVSVAHPAPVMIEYQNVRRQCERRLMESGLKYTILRPWYVLGPGHWWPYLLVPFYRIAESLSRTRETAFRLGLVSHAEMVETLAWAVKNPPAAKRILEVPQIRNCAARETGPAPDCEKPENSLHFLNGSSCAPHSSPRS